MVNEWYWMLDTPVLEHHVWGEMVWGHPDSWSPSVLSLWSIWSILSKQHSPSIKLLSSSKFNHRIKKKSSQSPEILGALPGLSHFVHSLLCFFLLLRFTLFSRRRFIGLSMTCILQQLPTSLEECTCQLPDSDVIYNIATKTFMVFKRLIRM